MRAIGRITVIFLFGLVGSCASTPSHREKPMTATAARPNPWTLVYADGSANVYRFSEESAGGPVHFEYIPVTPEQSSTGQYSGGDPKLAQIAAGDRRIEELWRHVDALESDPSLRSAQRAKRTGQFTITSPAGTRSFIIQLCPGLTELDEFLLSFRR